MYNKLSEKKFSSAIEVVSIVENAGYAFKDGVKPSQNYDYDKRVYSFPIVEKDGKETPFFVEKSYNSNEFWFNHYDSLKYFQSLNPTEIELANFIEARNTIEKLKSRIYPIFQVSIEKIGTITVRITSEFSYDVQDFQFSLSDKEYELNFTLEYNPEKTKYMSGENESKGFVDYRSMRLMGTFGTKAAPYEFGKRAEKAYKAIVGAVLEYIENHFAAVRHAGYNHRMNWIKGDMLKSVNYNKHNADMMELFATLFL